MSDLVKTAVIGTAALAGVYATVKVWPLEIKKGDSDGGLADSARSLLDLLPNDVVRSAENALSTVEAEISQQVAKRVAVGVFAGVLVGVMLAV